MMGLIENFKKIALVILLFYATDAFAQTQKIHTLQATDGTATETMSTDALIQLDSKKKGLLLPRVALTDAKLSAPLAIHTAGMTVYNTATVSSTATVEGVTPGYYYNNGTKWVRLAKENEAWTLTGNGGTNSETNFIGTTDNQALNIRTNNTNKITVLADGKVGIGTKEPSEVLEVNGNISVGYHKAIYATVPNELGYGSRLFFGGKAGNSDPLFIARYNVSSDVSELRMVLGDNKVGDKFVVGTLGDGSGNKYSDAFTPRFTVGSSGNVGIGTTESKAELDVNGNVKIVDGTQGENKVLTSDAFGNASWRTVGLKAPQGSLLWDASGGGNQKEDNGIKTYDNNGAGYTVPRTGYYMVNSRWFYVQDIEKNPDLGAGHVWIQIDKSPANDMDKEVVVYEYRFTVNKWSVSPPSGSFIYLEANTKYYIHQKTNDVMYASTGERKFYLMFIQ